MSNSVLPHEKSFHIRNHGKTFRSLKEMKENIDLISEEDFQFHMKNGNNDFSEWIKYVIKDEKLAAAIKKIKTKKGFVKKLEESGI